MYKATVKLDLDVNYGTVSTDLVSPNYPELTFDDFDIVDSGYNTFTDGATGKIPLRQYEDNIPTLLLVANTDDIDTLRISFVDSAAASVIITVKPGEFAILPTPHPFSGQEFITVGANASGGTGVFRYFVFGAHP